MPAMVQDKTKCTCCGTYNWNSATDSCERCGITGQAVRIGFSRMRRISKRFRYLNPKKLKKRRKHGRPRGAPSRLVLSRSPLRQSEAAQIAARQAATLRRGQSTPQTAQRRSGR